MRAFVYAAVVAAMIAFGFGVYHAAAVLKTTHREVIRPTAESGPSLAGRLYVAQDGALYRLEGGRFTQITDNAGWTEPAVSPDGTQLVAVRRIGNYSDVYLLSTEGRVIKQLTHHSARQVEYNHWSFFPRFSADGSKVFYSYDAKDPGSYEVDLAIFSLDVNTGVAVQWTEPNPYTGGDVDPIPMKDGRLLYTKYSIDDKSQVHSQLWLQAGPGTAGVALTQPEDNCASPALSPDGGSVAMICRREQLQSADVVTETFAGDVTLATPVVLASGRLAAAPAFAPDGHTVVFLAPVEPGGAFQLWSVPVAATTSGATAKALTSNVGLDATSAPAWAR
jgi:Tol biopolymer transport system component